EDGIRDRNVTGVQTCALPIFDKYTDRAWEPATERVRELFSDAEVAVPTQDDWLALKADVQKYGIYNQNLQAVPPTGSISYINNSTSSIHPVASKIEIRKEGKIGRVYYPAPYLTNDNLDYYQDAYEIGYEKIIDTYAAATQHVDQGLSLTLFFKDTATTREVNRAQIYAWRKGIKTLYYIRVRQLALEVTEVVGCVACMPCAPPPQPSPATRRRSDDRRAPRSGIPQPRHRGPAQARRPCVGDQLEPHPRRDRRSGLGAAHQQLLAAGEGPRLQRHPVVGDPHGVRADDDHPRLHRAHAPGHPPGHRRRREHAPRRLDPARGGGAHQHRLHGVGARQELLHDLLH